MKTTIVILSVMLFALFSAGCGDDNVTNNNTGNPNYTIGAMVYSIDDDSVDGDTTGGQLSGSLTRDEGYKITYTLTSSTDSTVFGYSLYNLAGDTIYFYKTHQGSDSTNGNYEFILDSRSWGTGPGIAWNLYDFGLTAGQFIALRNFKIYTIDYND